MYFAVYAHSMLYEPHRWCYDAEGLVYLLERFEQLDAVTVLPVENPLAENPFNHNRPEEDLCVLAWCRSDS